MLILGIRSKACITKKYRNVYVYNAIVPSSIYICRHIPHIMRLLKTHPILGLANSFVIDSPQPANISYL